MMVLAMVVASIFLIMIPQFDGLRAVRKDVQFSDIESMLCDVSL